jgi:hypothetical protein
MGAVIVGLIHFFPTEQELQAQIDRQYPKAALDFMRTQHSGRIFNSVEFGGYMEWNYPGLKPFIDGRGDIFIYNGIYDDYAGVTGLTRPLEALDKYHIDYVLVERNWPLTYLLENSPGWQLIHSDDVAKVFRHGPPLAVSDDSLAK